MTNRRKLTLAVAASALLIGGATACGTERTTPVGAGAQAPAKAAGAAGGYGDGGYGDGGYGSAGGGDGAGAGTASGPLAVRQDAKLGTLVADSAGFTLYRFDKDTASPSRSNCAGACATAWPPVPAGTTLPGAVPKGSVGSVDRADGTKQLTIGGWPVYRYAKDTAPGQTNGQGVGGTWFAVTPEGKKAGQGGAGEGGTAGQGGAEGGGAAALPALSTVEDQNLGAVLRDGKGRTLYRFTKDTAWPMKSNCQGACLEKWKPAKPVDVNDVKGVDPKLLSVYTRSDGGKQLAIDCWPLYWFTGDTAPGQVNGQGVGGTWFAVTPQGKLAK
ncbi:SCO0930 family lipoprotein [Streptomyces sp. NPDC101118]|uniref:SCO0930 family lipoprotein n=1 Tax=Streptomyces sp. NPDC101118 TaxID=3366109 RepID=UPI0038002C32